MANWIKKCTVVDGLTRTGLRAPDGSYYVVEATGLTRVGIYHPCGAYWVTPVTEITRFYAKDGSINILDTIFTAGLPVP